MTPDLHLHHRPAGRDLDALDPVVSGKGIGGKEPG
jgi:hypothetical protein